MIKVEQVSKTFQLNRQQRREMAIEASQVTAVDNVSFECSPGRVFSLLGPNGAGKTTTLRMISTILKATSGKITVNNFDAATEARAVRSSIGFMTGSTKLYQRLTPNEVVKYFADLYHMDKAVFKKRKEELFDLLDMHDFAKKRIGQLSTGMKQKVSIVRTVIHDPQVIVFDEPTSGLDVITAENIIKLIRRCREEGKTVIFSSHIMSEVDLLCDDLAIINKGKIVHQGDFESFKAQSKGASLTERFIQIIRDSEGAVAS